jgi:hypothetical protein
MPPTAPQCRTGRANRAAQAALERAGQRWQELEARYRRDSLDQVRGHLGQEQLDRAYARGIALSSDEALNLASGNPLSPIFPA